MGSDSENCSVVVVTPSEYRKREICMFRLFSDDQYLHLAISALPRALENNAHVHLMDVDRIGDLGAIRTYLSSVHVNKNDLFITLRRTGLLSKKLSLHGGVSLNQTVGGFYGEIMNVKKQVTYIDWNRQLATLLIRAKTSARQNYIIGLMEKGWGVERISRHLCISRKTVCAHLARAKKIYSARTHAGLLLNIRMMKH